MKETLDEELLVEHIKSYSTRDILMLVNDGELLKKLSTKSILPLVDRAAQLFSTNQMGDRTMSHIMDKIFFTSAGQLQILRQILLKTGYSDYKTIHSSDYGTLAKFVQTRSWVLLLRTFYSKYF